MEFDLENPLPPSSDNLFRIEEDHMPTRNYIRALHSSPSSGLTRRRAVESIRLLIPDHDPFSEYLAVNYLDRFLSAHPLHEGNPCVLDLVAGSCVSLALKMRKTESSVADFLSESGFMADTLKIKRMEMLILDALNWRMRSVNPLSFLNYFMPFFNVKDEDTAARRSFKKMAMEIIFKAQKDTRLLEFKPSVTCAAALLVSGLHLFPLQLLSFKTALSSCSDLNVEELVDCYEKMRGMEEEEDTRGAAHAPPVKVSFKSCMARKRQKIQDA